MPEQIVKPTWVDSLNPRWLPVMTEAGVCYSTNSVAVTDILIRYGSGSPRSQQHL